MGRFDELGTQTSREAQAAFEDACLALDALSAAEHPAMRALYEDVAEAAIRRAVASNKRDRVSLMEAAILAIINWSPAKR